MAGLSYKMIRVGRFMSGMLGLEEMFAELSKAGKSPDATLAEELVRGAKKENYIPPGAEAEFAEALLREYKSHRQAQANPAGQKIKLRPQWRGVPREQVPWYPTLAEEACDGCGKCIEACPEKVIIQEGGRVVVESPFDCQIGCTLCERVCPRKALALPPRSVLENTSMHYTG